ncbi:MAG: alpha/beta fold hydrolase [Pseudobdellovibrionaceae bacterium]|nr:alpha/beta fold hydrolase [Pseudobdellovibrionaceae bacterium]
MNSTLLRTGTLLPKALQAELDALGASYTRGLCDDPHAQSQTAWHLFQPGSTLATVCTILFHGTGNDALFCWENLILDLLKSGRAVFAFDLPGHGQSSTTELSASSFARTGMFLPQLLPKLMPALQNVEAVGYSLGAHAALQWAANGTMPCASLILMALPEQVELTTGFIVGEACSFVHKSWWQQLRRYGWDASFPAFGPIRRTRFPIRMPADVGLSYPQFVGHLLKTVDVKKALKKLKIPTRLIYGSRDALARGSYGQTLSSTSQLIQGANHFLLPLNPNARMLIMEWLVTSPQHPAARSTPRG